MSAVHIWYCNGVHYLEFISGDKGKKGIRTLPTKMILPNNVRTPLLLMYHNSCIVAQVTGWPGQSISVDIHVIDELNFTTTGLVELVPHNSNNNNMVSHEKLYSIITANDSIVVIREEMCSLLKMSTLLHLMKKHYSWIILSTEMILLMI